MGRARQWQSRGGGGEATVEGLRTGRTGGQIVQGDGGVKAMAVWGGWWQSERRRGQGQEGQGDGQVVMRVGSDDEGN